jgi:membrane protease YdiL (CAAX protease family)
MVRHVVLFGHDASLATTLRALLDPDDRLAEIDDVAGWRHVRQDEIDAVVVDLPSTVRLQAVEEIRSTYEGRLILLDPPDDPVSIPSEYDCLVIRRPDVGALWNLADNGQVVPSALSQVAEAGPTGGLDSARAPDESAAAETLTADSGEGGMPTPEGRPSVPILPPGSEDRSTDRDSIVLEMLSAQRPVAFDSSEIDRPLSAAPLQGRDVPQSVALEIGERLAADVVLVLLDNGEGLMEVSGGVGLTPADVRQSVEYSHDAMRELFRTSLRLIVDTSRVERALTGIPGSHAQTLLMVMLVHDHSWFGVLIAGRNRSRSGVPAEMFSGADVRSLVAIGQAATPSLHAAVLLRRLEWELKAGNSSRPASPGPATGAEASGVASVPASMPSPGPSSTLPIEAAPSAPSTQDAPAPAPQSAGPVDTWSGRTGRAAAMLLAYLIALATVDLVGSSPAISVPVAVTIHGLLALLLCVALRLVAGQSIAVLIPPLIAISVVRLLTLGALPGDVSPLTRLVVVGVPALVAVAMAARQRSPEWRLLRPHTGGWAGQLLVGLIGIPSALVVWAIAPPAVEVRGGTSTIVAATILVLFAALPEELLYRGLLVPAAAAVVGAWGIPFAAATYALAYLSGGSIATVLLAFLLGIVLGWCRWFTGSVVGAVGAHSLLNVIVYLVLPAFA